MAQIYDLQDKINQKRRDRSLLKFSLLVFETEDGEIWASTYYDEAPDDGHTLECRVREAKDLETLTWLLQQQIGAAGHEDSKLIVRANIYENSRVSVRVDERVRTAEQIEWVRQRLDDAKILIPPEEPDDARQAETRGERNG